MEDSSHLQNVLLGREWYCESKESCHENRTQWLPSVYKSRSLNCNLNTYTPTAWSLFWPSRSPLIWLVVILIKPNWSMPRVASVCQCRTVWICRRSVAILWKPKRSPKFKHICFNFEQYSAARLLNFCDIILSLRFVQIASNKLFNYHSRLWPVLGHILFWAKHVLSSKMIALKIFKWIITKKK